MDDRFFSCSLPQRGMSLSEWGERATLRHRSDATSLLYMDSPVW